MKFIFDNSVHTLGVRGVYFNIRGMHNVPSSDERVRAFVAKQLSRIPPDLESSTALEGFRELHAAVSSKPEKLQSSPAGLLSYFGAKGDIPRINGIVDVYNAISISSGLAIGAHDLDHVKGDIALRLTRGDERYWPLGSSKAVKVQSGEYSYIDSGNEILCRLEVRQVEKTKIVMDTHSVFYIVQGHSKIDPAFIATTADVLAARTQEFFGGELECLYP